MDQPQQEKILSLIERLSPADRDAVTGFAEFLLSRAGTSVITSPPMPATPVEVPEPDFIPRPDGERVVAAVKRLSKIYFMLGKSTMLGATSDLITQHIMQGREAAGVIDELEKIFADQYKILKEGGED